MTKSAIILLGAMWLISTMYLTFAGMSNVPNEYQFVNYARAASWGASILLLISIIIFIKRHQDKKKNTKG